MSDLLNLLETSHEKDIASDQGVAFPFSRIDAEVRDVSGDQSILLEGTVRDAVMVVRSGWFGKYRTNADGRRSVVDLLLPSDVINLERLLNAGPSSGVVAVTDGSVLIYPAEEVRKFCAEQPAAAEAITKTAIKESLRLADRVHSLGRLDARERLLHLLCEIAHRLGQPEGNDLLLEMRATQSFMADLLGLTPVHVNRTIHVLTKEGLLERQSRLWRLPYLKDAQSIANFNAAYLTA